VPNPFLGNGRLDAAVRMLPLRSVAGSNCRVQVTLDYAIYAIDDFAENVNSTDKEDVEERSDNTSRSAFD
jgi:hypothetical protein